MKNYKIELHHQRKKVAYIAVAGIKYVKLSLVHILG